MAIIFCTKLSFYLRSGVDLAAIFVEGVVGGRGWSEEGGDRREFCRKFGAVELGWFTDLV